MGRKKGLPEAAFASIECVDRSHNRVESILWAASNAVMPDLLPRTTEFLLMQRRRILTTRRDFLKTTGGGLATFFCAGRLTADTPAKEQLPPVRQVTHGPKHHWFAYYDKLQFDPTERYLLGMEVDFEHRSPTAKDVIKIGMVDLEDGDKWVELGESRAWGWQQGCMLQWRPGSKSEILWNDREGDRFVCHILDVFTRKRRTVPFPIYSVSADGKTAVYPDFARIADMRPGYGYPGLVDKYKEVLSPKETGIFRGDLDTGETSLVVSLDRIAKIPYKHDLSKKKHYFNHLLFNPDGTRFIFLHRWMPRDPWDWRTRMFTAAPDGSDIRLVDGSGGTSHFIWRDPGHILAYSLHAGRDQAAFFLFEDKEGGGNVRQIGKGVMHGDGHCTYLPNKDYILNDSYPDRNRNITPYLYRLSTGERIPLGHFHLPKEYTGEWRVDAHPRSGPSGKKWSWIR